MDTKTIEFVASFAVNTENSGTETAGTAFSVTLTARDGDGNTATGYTGDHSITWTWTATNSPGATVPTKPADGDQTFTAGVVTVSGFTLTNSGETPTITGTAVINGTSAAITVNDGTLNYVKIRDAAGGGGAEVTTHSMDSGQAYPVYAAGYDQYGNYISDQSVTWTATGVCSGNLSSTTGTSTTFTAVTAGTGTITADHATATDDTTGTITVVAGTASQVDLAGPSTMNVGVVSTVFTLTSQDGSGNAANVTSDTIFSLSSNTSGTETFYSNVGGTTVIPEVVTISNGSSSATFYYKDSNSGTPTVTATRSSGMDLGSDTLQVTVDLAETILVTSAASPSVDSVFKNFKVTVTKIEMDNGTSWVEIFSGAAELDLVLVSGGTFPGISDVALPFGTYSRMKVTFRNSLPVTGTLTYSGTPYYTTAATFGGADNIAGDPSNSAGSQTVYTFRIEEWGAVGTNVEKTFDITPVTVGLLTDYQPTLRFTIRQTFLFKGSAEMTSTYYFALSTPTVSLVEP